MSTQDKVNGINRFYVHHLTNGMGHDDAVAHISQGLGISTDAVLFAIRPTLELGAAAQSLNV